MRPCPTTYVALACLAPLLLTSGASSQSLQWVERSLAQSPPASSGHAMVYDAARGVIVLYGGDVTGTWEYDGEIWVPSPASGPDLSWTVRLVYDGAVQRVRAVSSTPGETTELWEWDGALWQQLVVTGAPSGRDGFAISYDDDAQLLMLFGGEAQGVPLSDTWELVGTDWFQRGTGGPPARSGHLMTFQKISGLTVLYGGRGGPAGNVELTDTWEWNGSFWFERFGIDNPGARYGAMTYDDTRSRILLFGGQDAQRTWEWDGVSWTHRDTTGAPTAFEGMAMAHDPVRGKTVMFGGTNGVVTNDETWEYSIFNPDEPAFETFGVGCAGSVGIPVLDALLGEMPYLGETFRMRLQPIPSNVFNTPFGIIGFSDAMWGPDPLPLDLGRFGMPGCSSFVEPLFIGALTNDAGSANWDLTIPVRPALIGTEFFVQGLVLDPFVNPLGAVTSNGASCLIGVR